MGRGKASGAKGASGMAERLQLTFEALSNERRRRILELVHARPRTASEIAREFDCSWPAISRHMKLLREAGLIAIDDEGDWEASAYVVIDTPMLEVAEWMKRFQP